jgi:hypothetical protein
VHAPAFSTLTLDTAYARSIYKCPAPVRISPTKRGDTLRAFNSILTHTTVKKDRGQHPATTKTVLPPHFSPSLRTLKGEKHQKLELTKKILCACPLSPLSLSPAFDEQFAEFRVVKFDHSKPEAVGVGVYFEKMSTPESRCGVRVARLQPGGSADVEGSIAVGDLLLSVDDINVAGERARAAPVLDT